MATLAATRTLGLQARPAQTKAGEGGLRGLVTGAKSAYSRFRREGLIGKRTGKVGRFLQKRWQGTTGSILRAGAGALGPLGTRASSVGDILFGARRTQQSRGQTVKVRDPASGKMITRRFRTGRVRGQKEARKLGGMAVGMAAQAYAKSSPESAYKFFGSKAGKFAGAAAGAAGGALAVGALKKFRAWQRAPKLRERTLKEFKRSPAAARIASRQRKALQARNRPIQRANIASRRREVLKGRSAFAKRERTITPRGYQARRQAPITRGYNRQIGRVAPTTIGRMPTARQYAGGSSAARDPYTGAARVSTYRPSTSTAAMGQRGRTRYTPSGSTYVAPSGRGTVSRYKTPTRRAPTPKGSYPSRAAYRRPTSPRPSAPKRSYASFRSQVKVSPARSSSRSFTPFARR